MPGISVSKIPIPFSGGGGVDWDAFWATLISATVENAAPTDVVMTFPAPAAIEAYLTIAGFTISSASWTGAVLTLVLSEAVLVYDGDLTITFVTTGGTATVTNNVADDGNSVAFYDYRDLTTFTKTTTVSQWRDKLVTGHDLNRIVAAVECEPTYTNKGVLWDGVQNGMKTAAFVYEQPETIYLFLKQITWGIVQTIMDGIANYNAWLTQHASSPNIRVTAGTLSAENNNLPLNTWGLIKIILNSANSKLQVGDTAAVTGNFGANDMGGITIGINPDADFNSTSNIKVKGMLFRDVSDIAGTELAISKAFLRNYTYTNVLVLGNSLTIHPIAAYWWGVWGMAATIAENDFVHKLETKLKIANAVTTVTPETIDAWELDHVNYDKSNFDAYFATVPDLVVIRLGENVQSLVGFDTSLQALIDYVKSKAPSARIVMTGVFMTAANKDLVLSTVAAANSIDYVELATLDIAANKPSIGDTVFDAEGNPHLIDSAGVCLHPNDLGMAAIADKIYELIMG